MLDAASWGPQMRPFPTNVAWLCHSKSDMRGRELNSRVALNGVPNCSHYQCVPCCFGHTGVRRVQAKTNQKHFGGSPTPHLNSLGFLLLA